MNKKGLLWYLYGALLILAVVALDQISKELVIAHLKGTDGVSLIDGVVSFDYTTNTGMAWGMLKEHRWVFMSLSTVAILGFLVVYFAIREQHILFRISAAFVIGGGVGNMIDRLFREDGGVVDFIRTDFMDFPSFNVADAFITVGAVMLMVYFFFYDAKQPRPLLMDGGKKGRVAEDE
ncbi:MAG: signal peptidase II [Clostridia bacterium]|nr:signal peptidase II [Clostridia bacterium]